MTLPEVTDDEEGADSSAARYIATSPEDITKTVFHPDDIPLLEHEVDEDGNNIEYKHYMPVVPIVLINGGSGIATGYSTEIPCYNPEDIVDRINLWLDSEDGEIIAPPLVPWYRGFKGTIDLLVRKNKSYEVWDESTEEKPTAWRCTGILEQGEKGWWHIREVPVGVWPDKVEAHIGVLANGGETKKKKIEKKILDFHWKGSPNSPSWDIKPTKDFTPDINVVGNFKILQDVNSLTNMHLLDENGYPRKFESPEDILKMFCTRRLEYYDMRRDYWIDYWNKEYAKETSRYKFVKSVIDKKLNMYQEDQDLEQSMVELGLVKVGDSFDYLLSMQMRSMTVKRLEDIKKEIDRVKAKIEELEGKTSKDNFLDSPFAEPAARRVAGSRTDIGEAEALHARRSESWSLLFAIAEPGRYEGRASMSDIRVLSTYPASSAKSARSPMCAKTFIAARSFEDLIASMNVVIELMMSNGLPLPNISATFLTSVGAEAKILLRKTTKKPGSTIVLPKPTEKNTSMPFDTASP
jgi:hypothetical protein